MPLIEMVSWQRVFGCESACGERHCFVAISDVFDRPYSGPHRVYARDLTRVLAT